MLQPFRIVELGISFNGVSTCTDFDNAGPGYDPGADQYAPTSR